MGEIRYDAYSKGKSARAYLVGTGSERIHEGDVQHVRDTPLLEAMRPTVLSHYLLDIRSMVTRSAKYHVIRYTIVAVHDSLVPFREYKGCLRLLLLLVQRIVMTSPDKARDEP
jgi:hypothetical protein